MKKFFSLTFFCLFVSQLLAYDFSEGGIYYNILPDGVSVEVTSEDGVQPSYSGYITIPENVYSWGYGTLNVTKIGDNAFSQCFELTTVDLPYTITEIGERAFYCCTSLSSVNIPSSVRRIGEHAFSNTCISGTLELPSDIAYIGSGAFYDTNISRINFAYKPYVRYCTIGAYAFGRNPYLGSVYFNAMTINFEGNPFIGCPNLIYISGWGCYLDDEETKFTELVDNCIYIGTIKNSKTEYELICCPAGKTSYTVPDEMNLTIIGYEAFGGCSKITDLEIPNTVREIKKMGLALGWTTTNMNVYRRIILPASVQTLGQMVFGWLDFNLDIYNYSTTPQEYSGAVATKQGVLHVPDASVEEYKNSSSSWKYFDIVPMSASPSDERIKMTPACWSTHYTQHEYTMPSNLTGYTVTYNEAEANLILTESYPEGSLVPANTPLLIKTSEVLNGTKYYDYVISNSGEDISDTPNNLHGNLVRGTIGEISGMSKYYKLAYGHSGTPNANILGWYWGDIEGSVFTLDANKAYLALPEAAGVKEYPLNFDSEVTSVGNVIENLNENIECYNINGQKLRAPLRGINIINGKKVIINN